MTIKILVSEDHALYRDGLRLLLQQIFTNVHIMESGDFETTRALLAAHQDIALVLLDILMPGTSGLEGLKEIKDRYPALPLVVISTVDQQASIRRILQLGADGFIAKTSSKDTMLKALKDVMEGELVVISDQGHTQPVTLSPRQVDTLELLAQGLPNKTIAARLHISPATVREYVSDILELFGSDNRTQAVLKARQMGFVLD